MALVQRYFRGFRPPMTSRFSFCSFLHASNVCSRGKACRCVHVQRLWLQPRCYFCFTALPCLKPSTIDRSNGWLQYKHRVATRGEDCHKLAARVAAQFCGEPQGSASQQRHIICEVLSSLKSMRSLFAPCANSSIYPFEHSAGRNPRCNASMDNSQLLQAR